MHRNRHRRSPSTSCCTISTTTTHRCYSSGHVATHVQPNKPASTSGFFTQPTGATTTTSHTSTANASPGIATFTTTTHFTAANIAVTGCASTDSATRSTANAASANTGSSRARASISTARTRPCTCSCKE
ncbi:hypothetical protein BHE74_00005467 [Ensete ventricosum]|nr:hypothetical protein BHE74_00005467 [Ensete ventricosum]